MTRNRYAILFLIPRTGTRALYLNPIEAQRLAASTAERFPGATVSIIDQNATDDNDDLARAVENAHILCLSLPSGSMPHALASLPLEEGRLRPWLLLFGEIVSDGDTSQVLAAVLDAGWARNRTVAFVGRAESHFLRIVEAMVDNVRLDRLPNTALLDEHGDVVFDESQQIPENVRSPRPLITESIRRAIADRGLRVLVDGLSRGCEHRCLYCHLNNRQQTSGVVQMLDSGSAEVLLELEASFGASAVLMFTDENFFGGSNAAARRLRLEQICQLGRTLVERSFSGVLGVDTRVETIASEADDLETAKLREESWRAMVAAGLRYAYLGTESFSETQLKRYGKAEQLSSVSEALRLLRGLHINFMAGLILLDPLVTPAEIGQSLRYIESHNLLGNVASLLKEMRVQPRSRYYRLLGQEYGDVRGAGRDMLMLTRASVPYADSTIQAAVAVTRVVHELFAESGYRHSDVAAFEALVPEVYGDPMWSVPRHVTRLEIQLLEELVLQGRPHNAAWALHLAGACAESVLTLVTRRAARVNSPGSVKVHHYYEAVFSEIKRRTARQVGDLP